MKQAAKACPEQSRRTAKECSPMPQAVGNETKLSTSPEGARETAPATQRPAAHFRQGPGFGTITPKSPELT